MTFTIHSCTDKLTGKELWFGIGQEGYEECMAFLNGNDITRYEYCGGDDEINFKWDVNDAEFREIMKRADGIHGDDMSEYCGAVFFGDYKLEFVRNDIAGTFNNLFLYGKEGYEWLEDGTPYDELLTEVESITIPHRRTFNAFAENIERQIIDMLNNHPDMIAFAIRETKPNKWYPGNHPYKINEITRDI